MPVALADRVHRARRHARRRRRQRHQHVRRPRHRRLMERTKDRPLVTGAITPRAALTFAIVLEVVAFVWLWAHGEPAQRRAGRRRLPLLRVRVHAVAEADLDAEHRHRRRRRRRAGADRLDRGHRHASPGRRSCCSPSSSIWTPPHFWALAIKYRDDYAAADVPMLPVGGEPADHRRCGSSPTRVAAVGAHARCSRPVADMGDLYLVVRRRARRASSSGSPSGLLRTPTPEPAMRLFTLLDHLHHAALRGDGRRPARPQRPMTRSRPSRQLRRLSDGRERTV